MSTPQYLMATYRRRAKLSQSDLARAMECDHSYVSRLEVGTRNPSRDYLLTLSHVLSLSLPETDRLLLAAGFAPLTLVLPPARRYRARMDDEYRQRLLRVWRDSREDEDERIPA